MGKILGLVVAVLVLPIWITLGVVSVATLWAHDWAGFAVMAVFYGFLSFVGLVIVSALWQE